MCVFILTFHLAYYWRWISQFSCCQEWNGLLRVHIATECPPCPSPVQRRVPSTFVPTYMTFEGGEYQRPYLSIRKARNLCSPHLQQTIQGWVLYLQMNSWYRIKSNSVIWGKYIFGNFGIPWNLPCSCVSALHVPVIIRHVAGVVSSFSSSLPLFKQMEWWFAKYVISVDHGHRRSQWADAS